MPAVFQGVPIVLAGVTWSTTPNPALPSGHASSPNSGLSQSAGGLSVVYRQVSVPSVAVRSRIRGSADEVEAGPHAKSGCQPDYPNSRQPHLSLQAGCPAEILVHAPAPTPAISRYSPRGHFASGSRRPVRTHRRPMSEGLLRYQIQPPYGKLRRHLEKRTCLPSVPPSMSTMWCVTFQQARRFFGVRLTMSSPATKLTFVWLPLWVPGGYDKAEDPVNRNQ